MDWEEATVTEFRGDVRTLAHLRFALGDPCWVEVRLGQEQRWSGEGPDLFEALNAVRLHLEEAGVSLQCNGARRDVFRIPADRIDRFNELTSKRARVPHGGN